MKNLIKFDAYNKELDNVETVQGLNETLKEWLESLSMPFEVQTQSLENFEFRRRDGFIPHSHNRGGLDLIGITDISGLMGSGSHFGTAIESWVETSWDDTRNDLIKDNPKMDHESDEFFDLVYQSCSGDYDTVAWRVRVMYEGNGVLSIYAGYDKDAPYFRWNDGVSFETQLTFKTISGLKRQLKALTKKVEDSQNETEKKQKKA
jgi:hypothetical protein